MSAPGEVTISSRFATMVGIRHPVVQEGLGPYKTVALAAAVSNAGGLGTVSMPGMTEEPSRGARLMREYIEATCALTDAPFAVNVPVGRDGTGRVLPFSENYVRAVVDSRRDPAIAARLRVLTTSAGAPSVIRPLVADSGLVHVHKVGGTRQAVRARADGVDAVIASGYEAGGHTHARPVHTMVLAPSVVAAVDCPVIVAGGVFDGATTAAALALGADAVALGTRFVASHDNTDWHPEYARRIVAAGEGDDVTFPAVFGPSRALRTGALDELAALVATGEMSPDEITAWKDDRLIRAQRDGEFDAGILPAGNVSGAIGDLVHVHEFVPRLVAEAADILRALPGRIHSAAPV
jgi:enoyl-[acyl-carrier protein] reductase II